MAAWCRIHTDVLAAAVVDQSMEDFIEHFLGIPMALCPLLYDMTLCMNNSIFSFLPSSSLHLLEEVQENECVGSGNISLEWMPCLAQSNTALPINLSSESLSIIFEQIFERFWVFDFGKTRPKRAHFFMNSFTIGMIFYRLLSRFHVSEHSVETLMDRLYTLSRKGFQYLLVGNQLNEAFLWLNACVDQTCLRHPIVWCRLLIPFNDKAYGVLMDLNSNPTPFLVASIETPLGLNYHTTLHFVLVSETGDEKTSELTAFGKHWKASKHAFCFQDQSSLIVSFPVIREVVSSCSSSSVSVNLVFDPMYAVSRKLGSALFFSATLADDSLAEIVADEEFNFPFPKQKFRSPSKTLPISEAVVNVEEKTKKASLSLGYAEELKSPWIESPNLHSKDPSLVNVTCKAKLEDMRKTSNLRLRHT